MYRCEPEAPTGVVAADAVFVGINFVDVVGPIGIAQAVENLGPAVDAVYLRRAL